MLTSAERTGLSYEVLEYVPLGVVVLREDYTVAMWNRCLAGWTGLTAAEMLGANLLERYPHLDSGRFRGRLQSTFSGGPPVIFSSSLHRYLIPCPLSEGGYRSQQVTVTPVRREDDRYEALCIIEDQTSLTAQVRSYRALRDQAVAEVKRREAAECQLRQSQAELEDRVVERTKALREAHDENKRLLESMRSLLIRVDEEGRVRQWNRAAEKILGLAWEQARGRRLMELSLRWCEAEVEALLEVCRRREGSAPTTEVHYQREGGSEGVLAMTVTALRRGEQRGCGYLLLGTDMTEQALLESQLRQAQKMEAIGQLAAGIAHEINTPTQYVLNNLRFLEKSFGKMQALLAGLKEGEEAMEAVLAGAGSKQIAFLLEETPRALQQSLEGIGRVTEIVLAMKDFSHPGQKTMSYFHVNEALRNTINITRNEWKYVAELTTDFDEGVALVKGYEGEFNQAILNILMNAAQALADKYGDGSEAKGRIEVRTRSGDDKVRVEIADNGPGIAKEVQGRIFEAFFTTKERGKGTGYGLSLCREVIEKKHGGRIEVESEEGQGATFRIYLPVENRQQESGRKGNER